MNLIIINLEVLILFQKTLTQYAPGEIYHRPRHYTRGAYYLPFQNEEYNWEKSYPPNTEKDHRRTKYNDYYISAEIDYGSKRLKCKCTCKRNYVSKPIPDYGQNNPCCPCDKKPDTGNEIYTPTLYPDTLDTGIYKPTEFPYTNDNGIYTPAPYPSIIYPTFDLSEIGKFFPWITWGITQTTKQDDNDRKDKDKTSPKDDRDRPTTGDGSDKTTTKDARDVSSTTDNIDKSSTVDDDRTSTIDDKDKSSAIDDRDRTTSRDDRDRSSTKDITSTIEEKPTEKSSSAIDENTTSEPEYSTTETMQSTTEPTLSTYPYTVSKNLNKLCYLPKKKKCLKVNLQKNTNWRVGRFYEDDLVERPTIASYLNGNRRRNNFQKKLYEGNPRYGIIPIPDNLAVKFMNELQN